MELFLKMVILLVDNWFVPFCLPICFSGLKAVFLFCVPVYYQLDKKIMKLINALFFLPWNMLLVSFSYTGRIILVFIVIN